MEARTTILLILATTHSLTLIQTIAGKLPKCKNQPDLLGHYASIFEKNAQHSSAVKREMSWSFSCLHAAIIKDENDDNMFSYQIYTCCNTCNFPNFSLCTLADYPNWQCGSEAYDCVFGCRDEDSVLEAVIGASSLNLDRKRELNISDSEVTRARKQLRLLRKERQCYEKTCSIENGQRECCLTSTCISLKNLVTELRQKKKNRAKKLRKAAKAAARASSTTSATAYTTTAAPTT